MNVAQPEITVEPVEDEPHLNDEAVGEDDEVHDDEDDWSETLLAFGREVRRLIVEHPHVALGIAVAAGLILGRMSRR